LDQEIQSVERIYQQGLKKAREAHSAPDHHCLADEHADVGEFSKMEAEKKPDLGFRIAKKVSKFQRAC